jgi:hypothetical protein
MGERIIFKWILERYGMKWIGLAQDKDQWRSLVNAVMHFGVS